MTLPSDTSLAISSLAKGFATLALVQLDLVWVFLEWGAVPALLQIHSILVLRLSFSKKDERKSALAAVALHGKVGAKAVKIALEELSLPTPLHPSSSSFLTFSFAVFCM